MFAEKRYIELFLKSSPSGRSGSFRGAHVNNVPQRHDLEGGGS